MHVLGCSCVDLDGDEGVVVDILWSKQRVHVFKQSNVPWQIVIYKKLVDQEYRVTLYFCMFLIVRSVRLCPSDITGLRGAYRPKLPVFFTSTINEVTSSCFRQEEDSGPSLVPRSFPKFNNIDLTNAGKSEEFWVRYQSKSNRNITNMYIWNNISNVCKRGLFEIE